jgi:hypothetical protein
MKSRSLKRQQEANPRAGEIRLPKLFSEWKLRLGKIKLYTTGVDGEERRITGVEMIESIEQAICQSINEHEYPAVAVIGPYVIPVFVA